MYAAQPTQPLRGHNCTNRILFYGKELIFHTCNPAYAGGFWCKMFFFAVPGYKDVNDADFTGTTLARIRRDVVWQEKRLERPMLVPHEGIAGDIAARSWWTTRKTSSFESHPHIIGKNHYAGTGVMRYQSVRQAIAVMKRLTIKAVRAGNHQFELAVVTSR